MTRQQRVERLFAAIPSLSDYRLQLVDKIIGVFQTQKNFWRSPASDLISPRILDDFGDVLRLHHSFSREPFSKDKFEYALDRILVESKVEAHLAPRGAKGFDIIINSERFSLKTEAARAIRESIIHISKFMELGGGEWGNNPKDLNGLRAQFMENLARFQRILILRALRKGDPIYKYELVEVPKGLLSRAINGRLEMRLSSGQHPKPGYCHVEENDTPLFSLYFDGGGERKLQIKGLRKDLCSIHAVWEFPPVRGEL